MPIELKIELTDGWKTKKGTQDVRGPAVVLKFISTKGNKQMFEWAPKLTDKEIIDELFNVLKAVETIKKTVNNSCVTLGE